MEACGHKMSWGIFFSTLSTAQSETHSISFHFLLKAGIFFFSFLIYTEGSDPLKVKASHVCFSNSHILHWPSTCIAINTRLFNDHYQQMSPSTVEATVFTFSVLVFNLHFVLWIFISQISGYHYKNLPLGTAAVSHFQCDAAVLISCSSFLFTICFWIHDVVLKILRISLLMKLWENRMFCHKRFSKYLAFCISETILPLTFMIF